MTHTRPMSDSEGVFGEWTQSSRPCPHCGSAQHFYRVWESNDGAYEDEKHKCLTCKEVWWIDGIDS
jgi:hypothetical protein